MASPDGRRFCGTAKRLLPGTFRFTDLQPRPTGMDWLNDRELTAYGTTMCARCDLIVSQGVPVGRPRPPANFVACSS
ncbi:hypothetical protein [Saccharopolyspora pogona]|uniref:hypothetical protein n=1 Tax=Saccharopolyspora pogona TaxID=333966 RepID=UPI0016836017|nr:hypothetical protein [Saccharopolyspora pogona]